MKNRYPGTCGCGAKVPAEAGEAYRANDGRWAVRCAGCITDPYPLKISSAEIASVVAYEASPIAIVDAEFHAEEAGEYSLLSGHPASPYQAALFDHARYGRGSVIVKAVAGSGKTTSIKNVLRYLPANRHVQLLAFNKEAAQQLGAAIAEIAASGDGRSYANVRAGTFHSVGYRAVQRKLGIGFEQLKDMTDDRKCDKLLKARLAAKPAVYEVYRSFITQLVSFAKGEGIGCLVPDTEERWYDLVDHHALYLDAEEVEDGTEVNEEIGVGMARELLRASNDAAKTGSLDYDDMIYLPVLWKLRLWQNDDVFADEAQDTNPCRRALLRLMLKSGGRLWAVGDPKQSIYGFTGASVDAMDLIAREFNTKELPLTVSYRCSAAIVERAQAWVPYIEPAPNAAEGEVRDDVPLAEALKALTASDAVLCRQTAPLVNLAYGLIARGRACRIMGREIGQGLIKLVEAQRARGIAMLEAKLTTFKVREVAKFTAKGNERQAEAVADKVNCLFVMIAALPEGERTVPGLVRRIEALFSDTDRGVLTLATVHKAKGQEWPSVAILMPELMPSRAARQDWQMEQETNLQYVAATRAKTLLIYCADGDTAVEK